MSIENSLERIAVALETMLAAGVEAKPTTVVAPKKQKAEKSAPVVAPAAPATPAAPVVVSDDIIPGQEEETLAAPVVTPVVEVNTTACLGINDSTQLRAFTQRALDAAEKESKIAPLRPQLVNELVTFIKGEVCAKYSPTEPKLIKIPAEHAGKAAQMIFDWCLRNKILITG